MKLGQFLEMSPHLITSAFLFRTSFFGLDFGVAVTLSSSPESKVDDGDLDLENARVLSARLLDSLDLPLWEIGEGSRSLCDDCRGTILSVEEPESMKLVFGN